MRRRFRKAWNKLRTTLYEFQNKSDYEEEFENSDPLIKEKEESISNSRKNNLERDEDNYRDLIKKGIDEKEAAHIVNRIAEKRLKFSKNK